MPQGFILRPLPFLVHVYVNDIVTNITSDIYLYADDTIPMQIVTYTFKPMGKKLAVNFSAAKSEHLIIYRKHVKINYNPLFMDEIKINRVSEHIHLGLVFTETFTWDSHINNHINKLGTSTKHAN